MVRQGLERFGHIDILVNNAGAPAGRDRVPVVDLAPDDWDFLTQDRITHGALCLSCERDLNRFFRQATGVSFGKLRMRARLAHAAHRLLTTDATADIIAREAGFSDGSHLHRLFVRHYGQTPGQYRTRGRRAPSQR